MTLRAVVRGVGHYLPERVVPNSEFEKTLDTSNEWIVSRSGIERRHFAAEGQTTSDLAVRASKAALEALARALAQELGPRGIRVNAVLPGLTDTHFASAITQDVKLMKLMTQLIPMARAGQPAEIAPAVLFLASNAASYVTGTTLTVDGGYLAL